MTVRGDLALIVMAGLVVVRRTMWVSPSPSSMANVVSETSTVRVRLAWARPTPTRWPQTNGAVFDGWWPAFSSPRRSSCSAKAEA